MSVEQQISSSHCLHEILGVGFEGWGSVLFFFTAKLSRTNFGSCTFMFLNWFPHLANRNRSSTLLIHSLQSSVVNRCHIFFIVNHSTILSNKLHNQCGLCYFLKFKHFAYPHHIFYAYTSKQHKETMELHWRDESVALQSCPGRILFHARDFPTWTHTYT